jgi:hypothetical protein
MKRDTDIDYSRSHDLTIEEVKACSVFQHLTDDEAKEAIETLKLFTKIAYDFYKKEAKKYGNADENS